MARTISYFECPYIIWKIKNLPTIHQLNTNYFYYDGIRLYLSLKQETGINTENDSFAMYLDEWGSWTEGFENFVITVCLRDRDGQSHLVQTTEVTAGILENVLPVWNVKRSELISKYNDLARNNTVIFVCTIGPGDFEGMKVQGSIHKEHKSVQVSLTVDERNLNILSDDFSSLLEEGHKTDVKLKCDDGSCLSAHKAVLSARSEVFAAMFRTNMSEEANGLVDIVDITPVILLHFLKYLYSGRVDEGLPDKTVSLLYVAGDKYAVSGLRETCVEAMVRNLSRENVFDFVVLADAHNDVFFKDAIVDYIAKNESLLKEKVWIDFWKSEPLLAFKVYKAFVRKICKKSD